MEIIVRPLKYMDVHGAAYVRVNGWKSAYKGIIDDEYLDSLNIDEQERKFEKCVGSDNFIVALENYQVVGFCRFLYDNSASSNIDYVDCELTAIYVHPDYKGQGIGKKMFECVVNRFYKHNKKKMIVWCLEDNTKSIDFYKHMGGEIKETKLAEIGNKKYKEVGIIYNIKELCEK